MGGTSSDQALQGSGRLAGPQRLPFPHPSCLPRSTSGSDAHSAPGLYLLSPPLSVGCTREQGH